MGNEYARGYRDALDWVECVLREEARGRVLELIARKRKDLGEH